VGRIVNIHLRQSGVLRGSQRPRNGRHEPYQASAAGCCYRSIAAAQAAHPLPVAQPCSIGVAHGLDIDGRIGFVKGMRLPD
jgi:hypothetical protein